jgi:DnaJ-class molecular chaperone
MKSPYEIIGVSRTATSDEIKKAYRKLAKELHPDLHPNDKRIAERFKEVSAAYSILSNEENRAKYDRGEIGNDGAARGSAGFQDAYRQYQQAGANAGARSGGFDFDTADFFSDIFGGGSRQKRGPNAQRGTDRIYQVTIEFLDAIKGTKKRITLENGKTLDVKIPVNVREGQQIRLKGQGGKGVGGGTDGDALIEVVINDHPFFRLDDKDIHLDLPVTLTEAVLGGKVQVPTIDGPVTLTVAAGSNSGAKLRLKGKGAADSKSSTRGDQYVTLIVTLPDVVDDDLRKAVESWSNSHSYRVRDKLE